MTNGQANQEMVELVAKALAADQAKRHYGIDRGAVEAWEALTNYGRTERLAEARAAIEACGIETLLKQQEEMREALTYIAETTDDERTSRRAFDALASFTKPALEDK